MGRHLDIPARAARKYDCPVVVIWGNHEPYGSIWSELLAAEERQLTALRAEGPDIRVLYGAATEIAGVRIIGAPLWTDLQLYPEFDYLAEIMVSSQMMDYRAIRTAPQTTFTVDQMLRQHARDKKTIFTELSKPHVGATVVMTHHMPLRELIAP